MRVLGLAALALAALTFGIAVAAGAFQQGSNVVKAVVPPSPAPAELAAIQQLVLRAAARMGDPSPTDGVLVPTTRRLAELVDVDTAEPDTPVYFVLVHGRFTDHSAPVPKGAKASTAALLTLTIDPGTNQSINTGLVSAAPDLNAIGTPEPLSLGTNTDPTANVPCPTGHERLVGPKALRRFHAVGAVSCTDGIRTYPGHGQWRVRGRRVAVGSVEVCRGTSSSRTARSWGKARAVFSWPGSSSCRRLSTVTGIGWSRGRLSTDVASRRVDMSRYSARFAGTSFRWTRCG